MQIKLNLKVLYVEDEEIVREPISEMLSRKVSSVVTATNGAEGIQKYLLESPDVIITDIKMPVMDGFEMIQKIRESNPFIPIIVTSAFDFKDYLKKSIELGINKYLIKPIERTVLCTAIDDMVQLLELKRSVDKYNDILELLFGMAKLSVIMAESDSMNIIDNQFLKFFGFENRESFYSKNASVFQFLNDLEEKEFIYNPSMHGYWLDIFLKNNGIENNTFLNCNHQDGDGQYFLRFKSMRNQNRMAIIIGSSAA